MLYKDFEEKLLHRDKDLHVKFSDSNKIYHLGCEPFEYYSKKVMCIDFLVDGEQVIYEVDDEPEYTSSGYFNSEAIMILIKIKED